MLASAVRFPTLARPDRAAAPIRTIFARVARVCARRLLVAPGSAAPSQIPVVRFSPFQQVFFKKKNRKQKAPHKSDSILNWVLNFILGGQQAVKRLAVAPTQITSAPVVPASAQLPLAPRASAAPSPTLAVRFSVSVAILFKSSGWPISFVSHIFVVLVV